jgi:hypothetical protein
MKLHQPTYALLAIACLLMAACSQGTRPVSEKEGASATPTSTQMSPTPTSTPTSTRISATSTSTPTSTPESSQKAIVTPPPVPEGFIYTEYGLTLYGLAFAYPEKWTLADMGGFLVIDNRDSRHSNLPAIFMEEGDVANFDTADPVTILEQHYSSIALGALKGQREILEAPKPLVINGQKAGVMSLHAVPSANMGAPLVTAYVALIVNGERLALIQGVTTPDEAGEFRPIFSTVVNSVQVQKPMGPPLIAPGNSYHFVKHDFARPNFYRLKGLAGEPIIIVAKPEEGVMLPPRIVIYDDDDRSFEQFMASNKKTLLAEAKGTDAISPIALAFTPQKDGDYWVGIGTILGSHGNFAFQVMDKASISTRIISQDGNLTSKGSKDVTFEANANDELLIVVQATASDADIRFEVYNTKERRYAVVDSTSKGQPEAYIFMPKVTDDYILKISSAVETDYTATIGKVSWETPQ